MKYKVRAYEATNWSLFTQADHFEVFTFDSDLSLRDFAQMLAREGFPTSDGKRWIMPGAIISVERGDR